MATSLFPIGTMAANTRAGTIDGISYYFLEPNAGAKSSSVFTNYVTRFQQQTMLVRKQALPYLTLTHKYKNIYQSEYNQLDSFLYSTGDGLTSFYLPDLSQGIIPSSISAGFNPTVSNTRLFSSVANQKAHHIFIWDGIHFKFGAVTNINATTGILTTDITATNASSKEGDMTGTQVAADDVFIYPVYESYSTGNSMSGFTSNEFVDTVNKNKGFMFSGTLSFTSRYKI